MGPGALDPPQSQCIGPGGGSPGGLPRSATDSTSGILLLPLWIILLNPAMLSTQNPHSGLSREGGRAAIGRDTATEVHRPSRSHASVISACLEPSLAWRRA